jgi:dephospho-CoA kinase
VAARPYVVALTGGIGSGKSTVAAVFSGLGVAQVDADAIAHQLSGPGGEAVAALVAAFGGEVLDERGGLDRARMRALAFGDDTTRKTLESILHPMIGAKTETAIANASSSYVIWVVPLLFETKEPRHRRYDRSLVVDCSEQMQVTRVMQRSGLSEAEIKAIMARQVTRKERLEKADDVIANDGEMASLRVAIEQLHQKYLTLAVAGAIERL